MQKEYTFVMTNLRGALIIRAEIIPYEPDPGNSGVGNGVNSSDNYVRQN